MLIVSIGSVPEKVETLTAWANGIFDFETYGVKYKILITLPHWIIKSLMARRIPSIFLPSTSAVRICRLTKSVTCPPIVLRSVPKVHRRRFAESNDILGEITHSEDRYDCGKESKHKLVGAK